PPDDIKPATVNRPGIYSVEGDTLRICVNPVNATEATRPTAFASKIGEDVFWLSELKRAAAPAQGGKEVDRGSPSPPAKGGQPADAAVEGGRAILKGMADKSHELVVRIERDGKPFTWDGKPLEWRSGGPGGEFQVVIEPSNKIPLDRGKTGAGFVVTFRQGAVNDVVNVLTEANPLVGTFAIRPKADLVTNGGVLTFADITLNDGKKLQVTFRLEQNTK